MTQVSDPERALLDRRDWLVPCQSIGVRCQESIKRAMDILLSLIALIILSPLLAVFAVLIRVGSPGPILFKQKRLGRNGELFDIYKFRTMAVGAPDLFREDGSRLVAKNDPRITGVGRLLRLGFDELPQLINVLKGEMSIVGPRPDEPYALDLYSQQEVKKLWMKPGITGLAEVKGRNRLSWPERVRYDIEYVENYSLWLDIKIMLSTWKIFLYH